MAKTIFGKAVDPNKVQYVDFVDCYEIGAIKGEDNSIEVQYTTKKGKSKNLVFTSRTKFVEFLDKKLGGLLDD